jgi:copper chaperone CopZ
MNENKKQQERVSGVLTLQGARCPSCVYTIEKLGRKITGVSGVRVDTGAQEIHVDYDGNPARLEAVAAIVQRLGYYAAVKEAREPEEEDSRGLQQSGDPRLGHKVLRRSAEESLGEEPFRAEAPRERRGS